MTTAAGLVMLAMALGVGEALAKETVTLVFVGPKSDAYLGFRQAVDEANRQGRFLGYAFEHQHIEPGGGAAMTLPEGVAALFAALPAEPFLALARDNVALPVVNLSATEESLRAACQANAFHAPASDRMREDALSQWAEAGNDRDGVVAKVWNTQFRRYAAIQLSNRFEEAQGTPMSDKSYAGWAGTRLYAQVVMEQGTAQPSTLLSALRSDQVQFDGQKGVPMRFRASGQLNQMILLEKDGKVVGTAPVRGVAAAHELDTLGFNGCEEGSAQ
ncbi:MAG: hypothetical protein AAGA68_26340 [Pseudomonadota bacterium]